MPFQFPIKWALFEVSTTSNDHLKIYIACISGKYVGGGVDTLQSLWILKRALELMITNLMSPFQNLYDCPFYRYFICPKGTTYNTTYNPCPEGCEGGFILKDIISGPFNYVEHNRYVKMFIRSIWGKCGRGRRGQLPSNHFRLFKRYQSFQFPIEWALFKVSATTNGHLKISIRCISIKYGVWGRVSTFRSLWILKSYEVWGGSTLPSVWV